MVAMRSPIPPAIREELMDDAFMTLCALDGFECEGRIQWHHAFTYAGKRVNEVWALIPLCEWHHSHESQWKQSINALIVERIHHFAAEASFKEKYPRSNLLPTLKVDIIKR